MGFEHAGSPAVPHTAEVRAGESAAAAAVAHQRSGISPSGGVAASSTHASRASSPAYSIFSDHAYTGQAPASPAHFVSSPPPPAVGLYETTTYPAVDRPMYVDNVYHAIEGKRVMCLLCRSFLWRRVMPLRTASLRDTTHKSPGTILLQSAMVLATIGSALHWKLQCNSLLPRGSGFPATFLTSTLSAFRLCSPH